MDCFRRFIWIVVFVSLASLLHSEVFADSPRERADRLLAEERFDELLTLSRSDFDLLRQEKGLGDHAALEAAAILGTHELLMGHPREAEAVLRPAVLCATCAGRPATAATAHLLNELGVACFQLATYAEARQWFSRAYSVRKDILGDKHVDTLQSLRNLAWAEDSLGNRHEAQKLFRQSYEGLETIIAGTNVAESTSSEAVAISETRPRYPRVIIGLIAKAPFPPPRPGDLKQREDAKGWVSALDRLHVMQQQIGISDPPYGDMAAAHATLAFGAKHFKTFMVLANTKSSLNPRPDYVPFPFGRSHPVMANVYLRRAIYEAEAYKQRSQFEMDPLVDIQSAEKIRRDSFGDDHPLVANAIDLRGIILQESGELELAIAEFEKSLAIRQRRYSPDHLLTGTSLAALGVAHYYRGEIPVSRHYLSRALEVHRSQLGREASLTAAVSSDLASVAREQGDYSLARSLLEEAVEVLTRTIGPKAPDTTIAMSNLAVVQAELGDLDNPENYFTHILASDADQYSKDRAELNLAVIARFRGHPQEAERLLKSLLSRNANNLQAKTQLGAVYRDLGDFEQAKSVLASVLQSQTNTFESVHTLSSIGLLSLESGSVDVATQAFDRYLQLCRAHLGSSSRHTAEALRQLGTAHLISGDLRGARTALEEAVLIKARWAEEQLPFLAEADAIHFAASLGELDPLLSVTRLDSSVSVADAYRAVWTTKSSATRAIVSRRATRSESPELRELTSELRSVRSSLAKLVQSREILDSNWRPLLDSPPPPDQFAIPGRTALTRAQFEDRVREVTLAKERLERQLAARSRPFQRQKGEVSGTPEELRELLPKNVAIVDIVKTKAWRRGPTGAVQPKPEVIYEAFVLRTAPGAPDAGYMRVELGAAEPIDEAINRWRSQFSVAANSGRGFVADESQVNDSAGEPPADVLRRIFWEKLSDSLKGIDTCVLIPDGEIARLPIGALPGDQPQTYLAEEITFVTAGFGQQVLTLLKAPPTAEGDAIIVGGVSFDAATTFPQSSATTASESRSYRVPTDAQSRSGWTDLPGTREEIAQIQPLWSGRSHVLVGPAATKHALIEAMPRSRFVHLATHGFFSQEPVKSVLALRGQDTTLNGLPFRKPNHGSLEIPPLVESIVGRNPLVLSGVVLAGANSPEGDGLLTAEELVDLDLSNTELVTLSACETGLGTTAGGEGVFGLQRAIGLAGARSSLATLWRVDDAATKVLMVEFYRNLWEKKMSRSQSLRAAQLRMLRGELSQQSGKSGVKRLPPYYWAAFVLSGDWR